jgi:hypothetical protein
MLERTRFIRLAMTLLLLWSLSAPYASGQGAYDDVVLGFKRLFAANEVAALNEPYVGVTTSAVVRGLFPVEATGVSTTPIKSAAEKFLATLTRAQQIKKTVFAVDDPEWRRWSNVDNGICVRQGISLEEMTTAQRDAAHARLKLDQVQLHLNDTYFAWIGGSDANQTRRQQHTELAADGRGPRGRRPREHAQGCPLPGSSSARSS